MNLLIGIVFTLIYLALGWLMGFIGGIHGPELIGDFVLAYLGVGLIALWGLYFFLRRRDRRRKALIFAAGGVAIGVCLIGASDVTRNQLLDRDSARSDKQAAATEVLNMHDEPLLSPKGNPVGVRLRYSMRFPDNGYFWQGVALDPETDLGLGIWAEGRPIAEMIDPPLQTVEVASNPLPKPNDPPGFGVSRHYDAGKLYNFTVDLVPYFLMLNERRTGFCVVLPPAEYTAAFQKLLAADNNDVRFKIAVHGTKYSGLTDGTYNLKAFHDNAVKEGAKELPGAGLGGAIIPCK